MAKYLKLFMVALFAALTFTLTSCGDDDEPSVGNIVGTWKLTAGLSADYGITQYVQFRADGTATEVDIDEDGTDVMNGTWKLEGNLLTLINHDEEWDMDIPTVSTVEKVTNSELVLTTLGIKQTYKKVADSEIDKYLK